MGFDSVLPKHNDNDHNISPLLNVSISCGAVCLERFIAMKYSLKYNSIVTTRRLAVAIALCWLFTGIYFPPMFIKARITRVFAISTSLAVICFCHLSVYFVCRRHLNRIKSEQISREARKKFLDDQNAWRTTIIVLSGFILSFLPEVLRATLLQLFSFPLLTLLRPLTFSCIILNSFLSPVIYCWRSQFIRQGMMQLLGKNVNNV